MPRVIKQPRDERVQPVTLERVFAPSRAPRIPGHVVRMEEGPEAPVHAEQGHVLPEWRTADAEPFAVTTPAALPADPPAEGAGDEEVEEVPEPPSLQELEAAWMERVEEAAAAARQEGYEQGRAEAEAAADEELTAVRDAFVRDLAGVEEAWQQYVHDAGPMLADLAFELARTVLQAPLPDDVRGLTEKTLSEAVDRLAAAPSLDVRLHPVDYLRLEESGVAAQLAAGHSGLRWHPDADLRQGDWIVESPSAVVRRLQDELLETLRDRLGLLGEAPETDDPSAAAS